jgi:pre-60S factor REI1
MLSKKHRENEFKVQSRVDRPRSVGSTAGKATSLEDQTPNPPSTTTKEVEVSQTHPISGQPGSDDPEDEGALTLDEKIAAARSRLSSAHCFFCTHVSSSLEVNLAHMADEHSFFIPDTEYLVDLTGLIVYLGEKIAVGNVCLYCNGKGREFHTLDAVRKHMVDKSHCKIAYDTEDDMLEISDYYDFSSSYPDAEERRRRKEEKRKAKREKKAAADGWEDVDDSGGEVDEVVDDATTSSSTQEEEEEDDDEDDEDDSSDTDSLPSNQITLGDSHLELVLPSGSRIGHRSMRRYYAQSFSNSTTTARTSSSGKEDPNSGRQIVRRLLADRHKSALVPRKCGFGAFGAGTQVVKARNRGEAREAGRHIREFRDQKRKEDYKTRVAFVHNHQKHYRDPLLQVGPIPFLDCTLFFLRAHRRVKISFSVMAVFTLHGSIIASLYVVL